MARGRITEASITAVREHSPIDKVVAEYVTLKNAGAGTVKGLCPFHDEGSPSFHVNPSRGFYHCFGCQASGDVIKFVQEIDGLDFVETIERLAGRFGIDLQYDDTGTPTRHEGPRHPRARLVAANAAAAEFYTSQLFTPEAVEARRFLAERHFTRDDCAPFGVGYSPNGWDVLIKHLAAQGFTPEELDAAGLTSTGRKGLIDRFRGRLMWPIRDTSGDIVGFGARKLLPDDQDKGPKYLNTAETALYKKNRVLYGLDLARKNIASSRRVVIVEGYTDVMACHLSGETTAVATCGTAFGDEHIRVIRRLLSDDGSGGEVIYTFDGDQAGQKAALRAFTMDEHFQTRTSVAVEPEGMDPCEVRIARGPGGVADLLDNRIPLFEFAIKASLGQFDMSTEEGRVNALAATTPILANIKHAELRDSYAGKLARWTGTARDAVAAAVRRTPTGNAQRRHDHPATHSQEGLPASTDQGAPVDPFERPDPKILPLARDVLKVLIQDRMRVQAATAEIRRGDFLHPTHRAVYDAITAASGEQSPDPHAWVAAAISHAASPAVAAVITELAVEPMTTRTGITPEIASKTFIELVVDTSNRRLDHLQRAIGNPDLDIAQLNDLIEDLTKTTARLNAAKARYDQFDMTHF